jgi:Family of unknown function (DUF6196)
LWIEIMDVTPETPVQTSARLLRVMAHARMDVLTQTYTFEEHPVAQFPAHLATSALAFVRDHAVWSALVPAQPFTQSSDSYTIVAFHFAPDIPNSGFVGWLASEFKRQLGTGVFVVCGQNSADGGVFDYWGIPMSVSTQALRLISTMQEQGRKL